MWKVYDNDDIPEGQRTNCDQKISGELKGVQQEKKLQYIKESEPH